MKRQSGSRLRGLGGCLVVLFAVVACSGVTVLAVDQLCYTTLSQRIPLNPNAEVREERHNFIRAWGMGETYFELYTPDGGDAVGEWYGSTAGRYSREALRSNDVAYLLGTAERSFRRADDGVGTFIQLYGTCAQ